MAGLKAEPTLTSHQGGKCNFPQEHNRYHRGQSNMKGASSTLSEAPREGRLRGSGRVTGKTPGNSAAQPASYFIRRRIKMRAHQLTFQSRVIKGPPLETQENLVKRALKETPTRKQPRRHTSRPLHPRIVDTKQKINRLDNYVLTNVDHVENIMTVVRFLDNQGSNPFVTKRTTRLVNTWMDDIEHNRTHTIARQLVEDRKFEQRCADNRTYGVYNNMYGADACSNPTRNIINKIPDNRTDHEKRLIQRAKKYKGTRKLTDRFCRRQPKAIAMVANTTPVPSQSWWSCLFG